MWGPEGRYTDLLEHPWRLVELFNHILKKYKVPVLLWGIYINSASKPDLAEKLGLDRKVLDDMHKVFRDYIEKGIEPEELEEEELEEEELEEEEEEEEF